MNRISVCTALERSSQIESEMDYEGIGRPLMHHNFTMYNGYLSIRLRVLLAKSAPMRIKGNQELIFSVILYNSLQLSVILNFGNLELMCISLHSSIINQKKLAMHCKLSLVFFLIQVQHLTCFAVGWVCFLEHGHMSVLVHLGEQSL